MVEEKTDRVVEIEGKSGRDRVIEEKSDRVVELEGKSVRDRVA